MKESAREVQLSDFRILRTFKPGSDVFLASLADTGVLYAIKVVKIE